MLNVCKGCFRACHLGKGNVKSFHVPLDHSTVQLEAALWD